MVLVKGQPGNLEKICLECWNFFAVAEGILERPLLLRSQMREHLQRHRSPLPQLGTRQGAIRFVLELGRELHHSRRPPLEAVSSAFEAIFAPHGLARQVLVLPLPQAPLRQTMKPGALLATVETLDLMVHFKNAFFHWALPESLSVPAPARESYLQSTFYYSAPHFLHFPGFTDPRSGDPGDRVECLEQACADLTRAELPSPRELEPSRLNSVDSYYLERYDDLRRRLDSIEMQVTRWLE